MGDDENKIDETARSDRKEDGVRSDPYFMSIPYGFQQRHHYRHNKKHTDLVDGKTMQITVLQLCL